jgi:hypothetical protein
MSGHSDKIALLAPFAFLSEHPIVQFTSSDPLLLIFRLGILYSVRLTETGVAALRDGTLARPELP